MWIVEFTVIRRTASGEEYMRGRRTFHEEDKAQTFFNRLGEWQKPTIRNNSIFPVKEIETRLKYLYLLLL